MRAWVVHRPGPVAPVASGPLRLTEREVPEPGPGELLVRVRACGVCRTDLHLAEGDLPPRAPDVTPGHEVVGEVVATGPRRRGLRFAPGDRVGRGLAAPGTYGTCRYCRHGKENLCPASSTPAGTSTAVTPSTSRSPTPTPTALPDGLLRRRARPAAVRRDHRVPGAAARRAAAGRAAGLYGFGGSAHLAAQSRSPRAPSSTCSPGATTPRSWRWSLGRRPRRTPTTSPPEPLDSAILFAPVGDLVPPALAALDRGGTLAIAGIHLTDIPSLNYARHLFQERTLRSVTANTRGDATDFLTLAQRLRIKVTTTPYPFDRADQALADLADGRVRGAAVLSL